MSSFLKSDETAPASTTTDAVNDDTEMSQPLTFSQKRRRDGYYFLWSRKRPRWSDEEMNRPTRGPYNWSPAWVTRALRNSPNPDRAEEQQVLMSLSNNTMDLLSPPVSRLENASTDQTSDPTTALLCNDAYFESPLVRNQGSLAATTRAEEVGEWNKNRNDAMRWKPHREKGTIWWLLFIFLVSVVGFRFVWSSHFLGWSRVAGKALFVRQCWNDEKSEDAGTSFDQPTLMCQRQHEREFMIASVFPVIVAWITTARIHAQSVVGHICHQLVQCVIVTPSHVLSHNGKVFLDCVCYLTMTTLGIICSYQFQSALALFILLVARVYNLVVSKRLEDC